jgi:hypothetical protein
MAAPKHVAKKLREMLGNEAGESMVEWLDERDTHYDELRREMRAGFAAVDARIEQRFAAFEARLTELDAKMAQGFAAMDVRFSQRNAELMKWALGFWIASLLGVVGALAALTRVPR